MQYLYSLPLFAVKPCCSRRRATPTPRADGRCDKFVIEGCNAPARHLETLNQRKGERPVSTPKSATTAREAMTAGRIARKVFDETKR